MIKAGLRSLNAGECVRRVKSPPEGHRKKRPGFALLLVLSCLLLVSGALVAISQRNLDLTLEYVDTADDFRQRWTEYSLEQAALVLATQIYGADPEILLSNRLATAPDLSPPEVPRWKSHYTFDVSLNGVRYQVAIADESARFNLNMARRLKPPQIIRQSIQRLSQGKLSITLPTVGQWNVSPNNSNQITSWGQVISFGQQDASSLQVADLESAARSVTLWGDGKLNLLRAPDDVLVEVSRLILTEAESNRWIAQMKTDWPTIPLEKILTDARIKKKDRDMLMRVLTTRSSAVSVWIQCHDTQLYQVHGLATRTQSGHWQAKITRYLR